jgi:4-cresol dehydrogenase (hydroxylating)
LKFYGSDGVIAAQVAEAKRALSEVANARVADAESFRFPLSDGQISQIYDPAPFGVPSLNTFNLGPMGSGKEPAIGHVFFSPIIPRTGEEVLKANAVLGRACRELNIPAPPVFLPGCMWERAFVFVVGFPITANPELNRTMRESFGRMVDVAAQNGWGEYRTAPAFYNKIMDTYSFNKHAHRRLCERIKDAVDPRGILSAGRYGIYPAHMRRAQA